MISPFFLGEFKYIFGRIAEGSRGGVSRIYLVKRCNFYSQILNFFVQCGYIKGYKEFNEFLVVYFSGIRRSHGYSGSSAALHRLETIRGINRRHSLTVRDLKRLRKKFSGSTLILSTDAGILTLEAALNKHVGGYPLFRFY